MQTKTLNGVEYGFVEVPEHSHVNIFSGILCTHYHERNMWQYTLPSGTWQIIGIAAELKEEEWKGIVETDGDGYMAYTGTEKGYYDWAFADKSGLDLIASLSMQPTTTLILRKQEYFRNDL